MLTLFSFQVIFAAAIFTLAVTPIAFALARRAGLVDVPNSAPHKQHVAPVPIAGGFIVAATLLAIGIWQNVWQWQSLRALLLSTAVVFLFGLWDDVKRLPPAIKLVGQILATIILVRLGVQVLLFYQNWLNLLVTMLWMIGITNAYNFVDSMDGLAIGLSAQASAFFMLVTYDAGQPELSLLSAILLGICIGCFYYNTLPAHFFLGDSGSQSLGFLLAGLAIAYNPPGFEKLASWYIPILLMGVPIFDIALVVFSRLRRQKPVYQAARDHTYHRLVSLGMSSNRAVLTMHLAALLLGCLAFIALSLPPLVANITFATVLAVGIGGLLYLDRMSRLQ